MPGLRELTRYRRKLTGLRTSCKDQVQAVLAALGIAVTCSDLFGKWGSAWLDGLALPQPYVGKVASLRGLITMSDGEIAIGNRREPTRNNGQTPTTRSRR